MLHPDIKEVLYSEEEISAVVKDLGAQLTKEYAGKNPLRIGVLKGAVMFMTDLSRAMACASGIDFMDVSSYGAGMESSGDVKILKDLDTTVDGRDLSIVEDIIDTGRTLSYLIEIFKYRKAKSIKVVTLMDKKNAALWIWKRITLASTFRTSSSSDTDWTSTKSTGTSLISGF